jgi:hypothetical protein
MQRCTRGVSLGGTRSEPEAVRLARGQRLDVQLVDNLIAVHKVRACNECMGYIYMRRFLMQLRGWFVF